ncbi:hypothetical protein EEL30_18070 [Brevibacillus laterosporus]|uniref:Uncharacterized protein n=1 Tax=Brevibacillus laterosporus TaxID=1465 RepID=A0A518VAM7_BRELA|nr:hypothetical protein EEL30_18070 [Brevibacillus laterosporus]
MLNGKKSYLLSFTALFSKKGYKLAFGINQIFHNNNKYHLTAPVNSTYRALKEDTMKSADKVPYSATGLFERMLTLAENATEYEVTEMETVTAEVVTYLADIHKHLSGINKAVYDVDIDNYISSKSANDVAESEVKDMEEASPSTPKLEVLRITLTDHSICNARIHDAVNVFAEPYTSRLETEVERFSNPIIDVIDGDAISLEVGSDKKVLEIDVIDSIQADPMSQVSGHSTSVLSKSTRTDEISDGLTDSFIDTHIIDKEASVDGLGRNKALFSNLETAATDVITPTSEDNICYSTQVQETYDALRKDIEYYGEVSLTNEGHNFTRHALKDAITNDILTANSFSKIDGDVVHGTSGYTQRNDYVGSTSSFMDAYKAMDEHELVERLIEIESKRDVEVDKFGIKAVKGYTAVEATVHQEEKGEYYRDSVGVNILEAASHPKGTFQAVADKVTFSSHNEMYNAIALGDANEVSDYILDGVVDKHHKAFREHPHDAINHQAEQAESQKIEDVTMLGHSVAESESSYELKVDVKELASRSTVREVIISDVAVAESSKSEYFEINTLKSGKQFKYIDGVEDRGTSSVLGTHNNLAQADRNEFAFYRVGPDAAVNVGMSEGFIDNVSSGETHAIKEANMSTNLNEYSDNNNRLSEAIISITADGVDDAKFTAVELIREQIIRHPDIIQTVRIMTIMYGARVAEIIEAGMDKVISNGVVDKSVRADSLESITQAVVDKLKEGTTGSNIQGILDYIEHAKSERIANSDYVKFVGAESVFQEDFTGKVERGTEARLPQSYIEADCDQLQSGQHNGLGEVTSAEELSRAIIEANTRLSIVSDINTATRENSAESNELMAIEFADVNLTEYGVTLKTESGRLDNIAVDTHSSTVDTSLLRHGSGESTLQVIEGGKHDSNAEAATQHIEGGTTSKKTEAITVDGYSESKAIEHIGGLEVHTINQSTYTSSHETVIMTGETTYSGNDRLATLFERELASSEVNENASIYEINYADSVNIEDETVMETTIGADPIYTTEPTTVDEVSESIRKKRVIYTDMKEGSDGTRVKKTIETSVSGQDDATQLRKTVEVTPNDGDGATRTIRTVNIELEESSDGERKRRTIDVDTELGSTATNETIPVAPKRKIWIILGKLATWSKWNWKKTR